MERAKSLMPTVSLTPRKAKRFWSGIWEHQEEHNREASWLKRAEQELQRKAPKQNNSEITKEILMKAMGKIKNWKAAGLDAVHGY